MSPDSIQSMGGKARAATLSGEQRREISRKAALARWAGKTKPKPVTKVQPLHWYSMRTDNGAEYVRMSPYSWAQWMGESLEIVNFDTDELEAQFQAVIRRPNSKDRGTK